jgi:hypothetical protein
MIRSVVFDVGETLLDETAEFGRWADWIGVPRHTFSAVLGAVTAAGRDNAETFQYFRPGFDLHTERSLREQAGVGEQITHADLYPDAWQALHRLRQQGLCVAAVIARQHSYASIAEWAADATQQILAVLGIRRHRLFGIRGGPARLHDPTQPARTPGPLRTAVPGIGASLMVGPKEPAM